MKIYIIRWCKRTGIVKYAFTTREAAEMYMKVNFIKDGTIIELELK